MSSERFRVTCVCTGNICRSPMAERVLEQALERAGLADRVIVDSAGTMGWHEGNGAHANTVAVLDEAGYRGDGHSARQLSDELFKSADLILLMDRGHRQDLRSVGLTEGTEVHLWRSFDPHARASGQLDIPDPWGYDEPTYRETLALLEAAVPEIIELIRERVL